MNEQTKTIVFSLVVIFMIVGPGTYGLAWFSAENGNENLLTEFWGFDVEAVEDGIDDGDGGVTDDDVLVPISLDVYKRGVESTDPDPTGYLWYDWDGDGQVDIGDVSTGEGEIETVAWSSGVGTSKEWYPAGKYVYWQLHKADYETVTFKKKVRAPAPGWDGTTALSCGSVSMMAEEDDSSDRVRVTAKGSSGSVLMVTASTDYNYTLYGSAPTLSIDITCATDDKGIGTSDYYHWGTAKQYKGSFIAIAVTNADNSDVTFSGDFDDVKTDGTYYWYIIDLDEPIFNDADLDGDGLFSVSISATITGEFDIAYINVFSSLLMTTYNAGSLSSGYVMQESNLDFVA